MRRKNKEGIAIKKIKKTTTRKKADSILQHSGT